MGWTTQPVWKKSSTPAKPAVPPYRHTAHRPVYSFNYSYSIHTGLLADTFDIVYNRLDIPVCRPLVWRQITGVFSRLAIPVRGIILVGYKDKWKELVIRKRWSFIIEPEVKIAKIYRDIKPAESNCRFGILGITGIDDFSFWFCFPGWYWDNWFHNSNPVIGKNRIDWSLFNLSRLLCFSSRYIKIHPLN